MNQESCFPLWKGISRRGHNRPQNRIATKKNIVRCESKSRRQRNGSKMKTKNKKIKNDEEQQKWKNWKRRKAECTSCALVRKCRRNTVKNYLSAPKMIYWPKWQANSIKSVVGAWPKGCCINNPKRDAWKCENKMLQACGRSGRVGVLNCLGRSLLKVNYANTQPTSAAWPGEKTKLHGKTWKNENGKRSSDVQKCSSNVRQ